MAGGYSITISAVDAATATFDKINKRVEAMNKRIAIARAPFDNLHESFQKFTRVTGLGKIATGFKDVARAGTDTFRSLTRVIEPLAAITGAASVAGMYRLVSAWGAFGAALGLQANRAGLTADQLQLLQNAARLANVSAETLTGGMTTLNDNMRNAAYGGAPAFLQTLKALGLSYDDLKQKNPVEQLKTLADALAHVKSPTDRAEWTANIFGSQDMVPLIAKQAQGIQELIDKARQYGTIGAEGVKNADAFRQAQVGLVESVEGLGNAIANVLGPALTPLLGDLSTAVSHMTAWVDANQAWLRSEITDKVNEFVTYIKGVDWKAIGTDITSLLATVNDVAKAFGGWQHVIEGIIGLKLLGWVMGLLGPMGRLIWLLSKIPGSGVALPVAGAYLGFKGAVANGMQIANAADLGLQVSGMDEFGNATTYTDANGNMVPATSVPDMLRPVVNGPVPTVPLAPGQQRRNAGDIADVFLKDGITREGAAAFLGSGIQESGLNPLSGQGTAHQGIFQWSAERQRAIEEHFKKPLLSMSPAEQAQAALWELHNKREFSALNSQLHNSHDLNANNQGVTEVFEAPGNYGVEVPKRLGLSQGALAAVPDAGPAPLVPQGDPAPLPSASGPDGAAGATGKVNMNVHITGQPAQVTTQSTDDINIQTTGLLGGL